MNITFNKKCPICLEKNGDLFVLSCLHKIHLDCCRNLVSLKCPLCQENVKNYPENIEAEINNNSKKYKQECEEEDREQLIRSYADAYSQISNERITPQMEIAAAVEYLRDHDIPMRFIPEKIEVTFYSNQPLPPRGMLFRTIIDTVLGYVIEKSNFEDLNSEHPSSEGCSDEGCSEFLEGNIFEEEDSVLESRGLNIRIRKI
jgi:hypothetical protein